jgi:hypothetical protein
MKGSLVLLPLLRTQHHRTNHLSLHFHATSVMMPRAPPVVAPLLVLRQNWETLGWLASWWSKPPNVNTCPHTVFIRSSVLRHKSTNPHPTWFWDPNQEAVGMILRPKSLNCRPWFWGPNQETIIVDLRPNHWQTTAIGFEAKLENPHLSSRPRVQCGSHTTSLDLPIVRPLSTRLVPDHPRSSTPSFLLLPQSSLLRAMSHSPPTHHKTSKHVSPHRITQYWLVQPKCTKFKFKLE